MRGVMPDGSPRYRRLSEHRTPGEDLPPTWNDHRPVLEMRPRVTVAKSGGTAEDA